MTPKEQDKLLEKKFNKEPNYNRGIEDGKAQERTKIIDVLKKMHNNFNPLAPDRDLAFVREGARAVLEEAIKTIEEMK